MIPSSKFEGINENVASNILVINGRRYDAKTGELLTASTTPAPLPKTGTVVDGFSKRPSAPKSASPAHSIHKKAEKSKTLMRGAVQKPAHHTVHAKAHAIPKQTESHTKHQDVMHTSGRTKRAEHVQKSTLISRFGPPQAQATKTEHPTKSITHMPVKQAPPISEHHAVPLPARVTLPNPFERAVQNATSHEQVGHTKASKRQRLAKKLRVSPKVISAGSMALAVLLLGGFFVYQNIPNLAMRVAATRSGVHASLPGYQPAGFRMNGPISYSAGKISIQYRSNSDDRNFSITQSNSEWNEDALLENFVAVDRRAYQTYQDKGKTIYIYDDNNATWVENGVWYQVEGKSSLNSDQLLRIANSL